VAHPREELETVPALGTQLTMRKNFSLEQATNLNLVKVENQLFLDQLLSYFLESAEEEESLF
jgi:hypothetical protein